MNKFIINLCKFYACLHYVFTQSRDPISMSSNNNLLIRKKSHIQYIEIPYVWFGICYNIQTYFAL